MLHLQTLLLSTWREKLKDATAAMLLDLALLDEDYVHLETQIRLFSPFNFDAAATAAAVVL